MASILLYDKGHIKWLELSPQNFQLDEKVVSPRAFAGLYGVMKFGEHILALAYQHPEKPRLEDDFHQPNALLILDLNLELKEVKEFIRLQAFTHWQREYLLLCSDGNFYTLDQHLEIIASDMLMGSYPTITSFYTLPDYPTGFLLENSYPASHIQQIIFDNNRFFLYPNTSNLITGYQSHLNLNTQTFDHTHQQWHIFGTYYKERHSAAKHSQVWLNYHIDIEDWEVDYDDDTVKRDSIDYYILEKFKKVLSENSKNTEILSIEDVITNQGLSANFDAIPIDILAITPQTPGWGIIRESEKYYLSQFNFGAKQTLTLSHFILFDEFEDVSFESQLMMIGDFLFVVYIDEFARVDHYLMKVFDISDSDNPLQIHCLKTIKDIKESTLNVKQDTKPSFDFFV